MHGWVLETDIIYNSPRKFTLKGARIKVSIKVLRNINTLIN